MDENTNKNAAGGRHAFSGNVERYKVIYHKTDEGVTKVTSVDTLIRNNTVRFRRFERLHVNRIFKLPSKY